MRQAHSILKAALMQRRGRPAGSTSGRSAMRPVAAVRSALAGGLEEKPGARLGLINPDLEQTCARHVVMLVAQRVRLTEVRGQLLVVGLARGQERVQG